MHILNIFRIQTNNFILNIFVDINYNIFIQNFQTYTLSSDKIDSNIFKTFHFKFLYLLLIYSIHFYYYLIHIYIP